MFKSNFYGKYGKRPSGTIAVLALSSVCSSDFCVRFDQLLLNVMHDVYGVDVGTLMHNYVIPNTSASWLLWQQGITVLSMFRF